MSRCVTVQTNVNTDTTFFLKQGQGQEVYSTITAADYVSTANLVVSSINNTVYSPTVLAGYSSITAANFISSADILVSTINGLKPVLFSELSSITAANYVSSADVLVSTINGLQPINFSQLSSLTALSTVTPNAYISSINNLSYPPPYQPNLVVSTLTAATNISTTQGLFNQINNATPISSFTSLPQDITLNTLTSFTWASTSVVNVSTISTFILDVRSTISGPGIMNLSSVSTVAIAGPGLSPFRVSTIANTPAVNQGNGAGTGGGFSSVVGISFPYSSISSYVAVVSILNLNPPPIVWVENLSGNEFCIHSPTDLTGQLLSAMAFGQSERISSFGA